MDWPKIRRGKGCLRQDTPIPTDAIKMYALLKISLDTVYHYTMVRDLQ